MIERRSRTALVLCFGLEILTRFQGGALAGAPSPQLVLIASGTRVGERAPHGWSDLVVKSVPKLASGDVETLPAFAASTAALFRSVILAEVGIDATAKSQHVLKRIGLGLAVPQNGIDVIVSSARSNDPQASRALGFVERRVLVAAESELRKARLLAASPTFAVLAAPSTLKSAHGHEKIFLIYALVIDRKTGELQTVLWSTPDEPARKTPPNSLTLLPKQLCYTCAIDVAAERLLNAVPVNWSFAMCALPPGSEAPFPKALERWSTDLKAIASDPSTFEKELRACLHAD